MTSSNDYESFFEESSDLFGILNASDLTIQSINRKAWKSTLNWSHEEVSGKSFVAFLYPDELINDDDDDDNDDDGGTFSLNHNTEGTTNSQGDQEHTIKVVNSSSSGPANQNSKVSILQKLMFSRNLHSRPLVKRFRRQDGVYLWIAWTINYVEEQEGKSKEHKFLLGGRDITKKRNRELTLKNSERRLRESQDMALIGQWDYDCATDRLMWSPIIYEVFGIDPEKFEATYEGFLNAIHPDDRKIVDGAWKNHLKTREPYEIDHRLLMPDGSIKWVKERCRSEYNKDGSPIYSIGTVQDISDLRLAKERAEESDRLKSAFLANMSHEIRTPMNAVIGFTDLMLMDNHQISNNNREYLEIIRDSGKLLLTLINDILDLSKIEAGQLQLDTKPFCLSEILRIVEYNAQAIITRKGHMIQLITPSVANRQDGSHHRGLMFIDGIANRIVADPTRLQQVLNNLLSNAIKFTESGSVEFGVKTLIRPNGKMLEFFVIDTGVGIPEEKQQQIFEPFCQAHGGRGAKILGGTGLGLSIALKLVESMGGEMSLESSTDPMNHGSTFHFTIPYVLANPINKRVHDGGKDGREKKERSNAIMQKDPEMLLGRVLLVDDNLVNLKLCQRFLTKMGCLSETAENGDAAVTRFKKDSGSFDIILMDKEMPVMDGLEAVQKNSCY